MDAQPFFGGMSRDHWTLVFGLLGAILEFLESAAPFGLAAHQV